MSQNPTVADLNFLRDMQKLVTGELLRSSAQLIAWLVVGNGAGLLASLDLLARAAPGLPIALPIIAAWCFAFGVALAFWGATEMLISGRKTSMFYTDATSAMQKIVVAQHEIERIEARHRRVSENHAYRKQIAESIDAFEKNTTISTLKDRQKKIVGLMVTSAFFFVIALVVPLVTLTAIQLQSPATAVATKAPPSST